MRPLLALAAAAALLAARPAAGQVRAVPRGASAALYERADAARVVGSLDTPDRATVECRSEADPSFLRVRADRDGHVGFVDAASVRLVEGPVSPVLVRGRFRYVGSSACIVCHRHEHRRRGQDPHRNAYGSLGGERARQAGAERGVAWPLGDPRCLRCHVTAWGAPPEQRATTLDPAREAVGCEACHGPGSGYIDPAIHAVSPRRALRFGMTDVSTLERQDALCRRCHNPRAPFHKRFDLRTAVEPVRHWPRAEDDEWIGFVAAAETPGDPGEAETPVDAAGLAALPACDPVRPAPLPPPAATPLVPLAATPRPAGQAAAAEPVEVRLDDPPGQFGAVRFPHEQHAHRHQPPHSCGDASCHHSIPIAGGKEPRTFRCAACHPRAEPTAEGDRRKAEEVYHKACVACHRLAGKGPAKLMPCSGCHARK